MYVTGTKWKSRYPAMLSQFGRPLKGPPAPETLVGLAQASAANELQFDSPLCPILFPSSFELLILRALPNKLLS